MIALLKFSLIDLEARQGNKGQAFEQPERLSERTRKGCDSLTCTNKKRCRAEARRGEYATGKNPGITTCTRGNSRCLGNSYRLLR